MAGDYARSVQILVEIAGNPEAKLDAITQKLSNMEGRKTNIGIGDQPINQVSKLSAGITAANSRFGNLETSIQGFGSKSVSNLGNVKNSLNELNTGVQNLAASLAGIAIGGSISGIAWMDSAKSKLYNEQIADAINNNKKLGISYKELEEFAKQQEAQGEGTKSSNIKEAYAILNYGQKFFKGTSGDKLKQADAIGDFWFKNQERMQAFGYQDPEQLVKMLTRTSGKMQGRMVKDAAAALGLDENAPEMRTAKSRMKYLQEMGAQVDMKKALDDRPWIQLETSISRLKKAIGSSIADPMADAVSMTASVAETMAKIPGLPTMIGLGGATLALVSAGNLLLGVLAPLWGTMKSINAALGISTALKGINTAATVTATAAQAAEATSHVMLTGAMGTEFVAEELTTGAKKVGILTRLRIIGVMAAERIASLATTAANYLGIPALLGLAGANTAAAGAATGLAVAEGVALSPLLLLAAAGLAFAGVLALILQKAGILEPLLKGISKINLGKVFKELGAGDLTGAWHQITKGFELPSMKEAFTNLLGPSMTTTLTKVFGITMNRMLEWLNSINDELKRIRALWDYIIGLVYKYIWEPLKGLWDLVKSLVAYFIGGNGLTNNDEIAKALREKITAESAKGMADTTYGTPFRGISPEALDYIIRNVVTNPDEKLYRNFATNEEKWAKESPGAGWNEKTPIGVTGPSIEEAKKIVDELKNPKPGIVSGAIQGLDDIVSGAIQGLDDKTKEVVDNTNKKLDAGVPAYAAADWSVISPIKYAYSAVEGAATSWWNGGTIGKEVTQNAVGGEVTKSGLAWVDTNEPIIPAEVNRNSHLINVLESIAGGSSNSVNNSRGNIIVNVDYKVSGPGSGNGMYLDKFAFERAVTEIIGKVTRHYGAY